MATVVNHLKGLVDVLEKNGRSFLFKPDNRLASGTLTTRDGGPVSPGLYAPGDLHHHVLTRRGFDGMSRRYRTRSGRLVMATYATRVDRAGVLRYDLLWQFDLSVPAADHPSKPRGAFEPLPGWRGVTVAIARVLVDAVLDVARGGPTVDSLRMTMPLAEATGEIAFDARPVYRAALEMSAGRMAAPDCITGTDCLVMGVVTGYQDRQFGTTSPRTMVHLRPKGVVPKPGEPSHAGDQMIVLPENCQLMPELVAVANGYTPPGVLELAAGTQFGRPLAPRERTRWAQVEAELADADLCRWFQEQAVVSEQVRCPDGFRPAELQKPDPAVKVCEWVRESPVARVVDVSYNPNGKLIERTPEGTAAAFDLWTLAGGKDRVDANGGNR